MHPTIAAGRVCWPVATVAALIDVESGKETDSSRLMLLQFDGGQRTVTSIGRKVNLRSAFPPRDKASIAWQYRDPQRNQPSAAAAVSDQFAGLVKASDLRAGPANGEENGSCRRTRVEVVR
jgi:hypothetical protein